MRRPPRLASVLLEQFAPGNEALHGDLDEEFSRGRSSAWYWRQVIATIARQGPLALVLTPAHLCAGQQRNGVSSVMRPVERRRLMVIWSDQRSRQQRRWS